MEANKINYTRSGNIDLSTDVGKMFFLFSEDEFSDIKKNYPHYSQEECKTECETRWYKFVESYDRYKEYMERVSSYNRKV
jgi:hypothetical protein